MGNDNGWILKYSSFWRMVSEHQKANKENTHQNTQQRCVGFQPAGQCKPVRKPEGNNNT